MTNTSDNVSVYSIEDLDRLADDQIETMTPWTKQKDLYDGIYLNQLIAEAGYQVGDIQSIRVYALNDYEIEIPQQTLISKAYFLAFYKNGRKMPLRQKGPLTIILDFSDEEKGNNLLDITYDLVWFVNKIEIIK
ncbi:hypothetical protein [Photobacterium sanguinicancri]|uniref:hypothetical protein n=1 Tax=Photobacterium sanguinicancri TaxID=875932 RepID=UPI0012EE5C68|nr:hypothetical protein [Photobacterium sanguinicancri]